MATEQDRAGVAARGIRLAEVEEASPRVLAALDRALDLSEWIQRHCPTDYPRTGGQVELALAWFAMALDHREAIILLVHRTARHSAYALVRPMFDCFVRALWAHWCLTPDMLRELQRTGRHPTTERIVARLNRDAPIGPAIARAKAGSWDALSDFVHGGPRQVDRWTRQAKVGSAHPDGEVIELLDVVDNWAILSVMTMLRMADADATPAIVRAQQHTDAMKARLGALKRPTA